jgi:pimeloyl-ACP methyl ester carboxylesterase
VLRLVAGIATALVLAYAVVAAGVYWKQEALIFHPVALPADTRFDLPGVTEVKVPVDGATLSALHLKLPDPKGIVFFLHGNSGNLRSWVTSVDFYRRANFDLFIVDYRGFGKSTGEVGGEEQLHDDIRRAWETIAPQYAGKKVVVYGRSLGTGLATRLASMIRPDLTVLVSPYSSLDAMAALRYPWLPSWLNRYHLRSDEWLARITTPVLILHGDADSVIPLSEATRLQAVRPATDLEVIRGAAHNDIHTFPAYLARLMASLRSL